jgi:hypothetical protein
MRYARNVNALSSGVHETFTWPWQRHPAPPDPHVRRWRRGPEGRHGRRGGVGSLTAPPTRSSADRATARRNRPPARVVWRGRSITTESRPGPGSSRQREGRQDAPPAVAPRFRVLARHAIGPAGSTVRRPGDLGAGVGRARAEYRKHERQNERDVPPTLPPCREAPPSRSTLPRRTTATAAVGQAVRVLLVRTAVVPRSVTRREAIPRTGLGCGPTVGFAG